MEAPPHKRARSDPPPIRIEDTASGTSTHRTSTHNPQWRPPRVIVQQSQLDR